MKARTRTSTFFDTYAHDFSAIYGTSNSLWNRMINRLFRQSMMIRYRKTLEGCHPVEGRKILDIGCGPGHYATALAIKGAGRILGIDFAPAMIELARKRAAQAGVAEVCEFVCADFMTFEFKEIFDYSIAMGFMDYVAEPGAVVARIKDLTTHKAFLSFPASGGLLAWQRKIRYRRRCDLYLYTRDQIKELLEKCHIETFTIERIARDFFVTLTLDTSDTQRAPLPQT